MKSIRSLQLSRRLSRYPNLFPKFTNDLPRNIFRSLVNKYADYIIVNGSPSKNQDVQSLRADLSAEIAFRA